MEKRIEGQFTNEEMEAKFDRMRANVGRNYELKTAIIHTGATYNYYVQHSDGSWTNTHCRTNSEELRTK